MRSLVVKLNISNMGKEMECLAVKLNHLLIKTDYESSAALWPRATEPSFTIPASRSYRCDLPHAGGLEADHFAWILTII